MNTNVVFCITFKRPQVNLCLVNAGTLAVPSKQSALKLFNKELIYN